MRRSTNRAAKGLCGVGLAAFLIAQGQVGAQAAPATEATTLITRAFDGGPADNWSYRPDVSADGRFIVFESHASNLVNGDDNRASDVFVYDRQTGQTSLVSIDREGGWANFHSFEPTISDDGQFIAFRSRASDLVAGDTNGYEDVFVYDRVNDTTRRASVEADGQQIAGQSRNALISGDGRSVGFSTEILGPTLADRDYGLYRKNLIDESVVRLDHWGTLNALSGDGRVVVYTASGGNGGVYAQDLVTGRTTLVTDPLYGGAVRGWAISGDGNKVLFSSAQPLPGLDDDGDANDLLLYDLRSGTTSWLTPGVDDSVGPADLSADGNHLAFERGGAMFLRDLRTGYEVQTDARPDGTPVAGHGGSNASSKISNGATVVALATTKTLVPSAHPQGSVFMRRPQTSIIPQPVILGTNPIRVKLFYQAQLLDGANVPMAGKVLTFKVDGRPVCAPTTDANGYASCTLYTDQLTTMLTRTGGYTVHFAGSATTFPSSAFSWTISG